MTVTRRSVIGSAAMTALSSGSGRGQGNNVPTIRIGVLTDLSGPYRDMGGPIAVACVRQAVQEFITGSNMKVEVLAGDFQNKADIGAGIARQWFDEQGVDVVVDVPQFRRRACGLQHRPREKQGRSGLPGNDGTYRTPVQPEHSPLVARHLDAGEIYRRKHPQEWR